jgi:hypothetical protein
MQHRNQVMMRLSVSLQLPSAPYLINISEDAALQGRLRFAIPQLPNQLTVGSGRDSKIKLGKAFPEKLCYLQLDGERGLGWNKVV